MIPGTTARTDRGTALPIPAIPIQTTLLQEPAVQSLSLPPPTRSLGQSTPFAPQTSALEPPSPRRLSRPEEIYEGLVDSLRVAARDPASLSSLLTPELREALATDADVTPWLQLPSSNPARYESLSAEAIQKLLLRDLTAQLARHAGIVANRVPHHAVRMALALDVELIPPPDVQKPAFPAQAQVPPTTEAVRSVDRLKDLGPFDRHQAIAKMLAIRAQGSTVSAAGEAAAQAWWDGDLELAVAILEVDPDSLWPQLLQLAPEVIEEQNSTALLQTDSFRLFTTERARALLRKMVAPMMARLHTTLEEKFTALGERDRVRLKAGAELGVGGTGVEFELEPKITRKSDHYKVELEGKVAAGLFAQAGVGDAELSLVAGGEAEWRFADATQAAEAATILARVGTTAALQLTPFGLLMAPAFKPTDSELAFLRRNLETYGVRGGVEGEVSLEDPAGLFSGELEVEATRGAAYSPGPPSEVHLDQEYEGKLKAGVPAAYGELKGKLTLTHNKSVPPLAPSRHENPVRVIHAAAHASDDEGSVDLKLKVDLIGRLRSGGAAVGTGARYTIETVVHPTNVDRAAIAQAMLGELSALDGSETSAVLDLYNLVQVKPKAALRLPGVTVELKLDGRWEDVFHTEETTVEDMEHRLRQQLEEARSSATES